MFFLPTLVVGPINRFGDFLRDHRRRRWDGDQFARGVTRIVYGYTKIVVISNYLINEKFALWIGSIEACQRITGAIHGLLALRGQFVFSIFRLF